MIHILAAHVTAHHAAAGQHDTRYWLTGILLALGVGIIAATVSKLRGSA